MKGLLTFIPDGRYDLKSFATDEERNNVSACASPKACFLTASRRAVAAASVALGLIC